MPSDNARNVFTSLKLADWRAGGSLSGGGQADVLIVQNTAGDRGVFRYLRESSPSDVERFFRELRVLMNPQFRHPAIVEILAHTSDRTPWYISRFGYPFQERWKAFRGTHANDPETIARNAVNVVSNLAEGLGVLHAQGVVHRDIKPKNIVVKGPNGPIDPVLIDFGLVHIDGEERLTDTHEAVGNKRYSPDIMMRRMDVVPPWLDIFQLSQLLIWMVQEPVAKGWDRPLDYRYVQYDDRLSTDLVLALKSVTALCSEESLSPKNGSQLAGILRQRFSAASPNEEGDRIAAAAIHQAMARGKAERDLVLAEDLRAVESAAFNVLPFFKDFRDGLEQLLNEMSEASIPVVQRSLAPVDQFVDGALRRHGRDHALMNFTCRGTYGTFSVYFNQAVQSPSQRRPERASRLDGAVVYFSVALCPEIKGNPRLEDVRFDVTAETDGSLTMRFSGGSRKKTDVRGVLDFIRAWVLNPELWARMERDR